jgi:hypothetical protein
LRDTLKLPAAFRRTALVIPRGFGSEGHAPSWLQDPKMEGGLCPYGRERILAFHYPPVAIVTKLPSERRKVMLPSGLTDWASPSSTELPDLIRTLLPTVST